MRIVLTGGGTGGHIVPLEPIIEALRTQFVEKKGSIPAWLEPDSLEVSFIGVVTKPLAQLLETYSVPATHIPSGKVRRYASAQNISDLLFWLPLGLLRALFVMWRTMPDAIVSKGGYGALPVVLAAKFYRIPILVHESDAIPGVANSIAFRFAAAITVGFETTLQYIKKYSKKTVVTGTPVRTSIRTLKQDTAKQSFQIPVTEKLLLVFGGSQGAQQINESLLKILPKLIPDVSIIHVTGPKQFKAIQTVATELLAHSPRKDMYKPYEYLGDEMLRAIVAADIVVCRAGATTLSELAATRKPALVIPLDGAAQDHQRKNANVFEAAGAAIVLDPKNLGMNIFEQNIHRLITEDSLRSTIAQNLSVIDTPHAAHDIAEMTFNLAQGLRPTQTT